MPAISPLDYLPGTWDYDRQIRDSMNGKSGSATGKATFSKVPGGLTWKESGQLRFGSANTVATRELQVVRDEEAPAGWMVLFDDGRPFHPLILDRDECELEHPCLEDLYRGGFRILGDDEFRTSWQVEGPNKDQLIETVYRRRAGS